MIVTSVSTDVKCHDLKSGQLLGTYEPAFPANTNIQSLSTGKKSNRIVITAKNWFADILSLSNSGLQSIHTVKEVQDISCASFQNTNDSDVILGTAIGHLIVFDIDSKTIKKHFYTGNTVVFKVQSCLKDRNIVSGCENGKVYINNAITGVVSSILEVPNSTNLTTFECHRSLRNFVAGGSGEGIATVWDVNNSNAITHKKLHKAPITDISISLYQPDLMVTAGLDKKICVYDYRSNETVLDAFLTNIPSAIDFEDDGINGAVGFHNGHLFNYDIRFLRETSTKYEYHNGQIHHVNLTEMFFEDEDDDEDEAVSSNVPCTKANVPDLKTMNLGLPTTSDQEKVRSFPKPCSDAAPSATSSKNEPAIVVTAADIRSIVREEISPIINGVKDLVEIVKKLREDIIPSGKRF